ncbi:MULTISPECIES: cation-transporting P-type ATPase [unclassified Variovorax]|nr:MULTISPECIES: cation-transporting P-type ATPase [unclassified Variovorax]
MKDADEVARALGADPDRGLTSQEASRRFSENGANELRTAPRTPMWGRVLSQFQDPLIYLLLAAIAIALVAWAIEGFTGWPVDAIVIASIVRSCCSTGC